MLLTLSLLLLTQTVPKEFEVASVRPNKLNDRIVTIDVGPGGRFNARGYTLALLIQRAYGVMDWNIEGPSWIRDDRFDVAAKAVVPGNLTEAQLQPMLQAMLADRFKLRLHKGSHEMSAFVLSVARSGAKVKASASPEEHMDTFRFSRTGLSGQGITMAMLARFVAGKLGLVGVDKTGLPGVYDFKVEWPEPVEPDTGTLPAGDPRDGLRTAVITALRDQLGLTFGPQKTSVETLVIDNVEKPSAN